MAVKMVWTMVSVLAVCMAIPSPSFAEHDYEITVTIGDTTLNSVSPHTSVPIAGTYTHAATGGSITITNQGGTAQVEIDSGNASQDNTEDSIRLINARITANNAYVTNFPITFKRRMISGPDTPPAVYYKMYAKGAFSYALGSSINIGWYSKNPLSNGFFFLDSKQYTPGLLTFTLAPPGKVWPTPPDLTGDRVPKIEFTVKLGISRYLDFDSNLPAPNDNRMIKLYTSASPDRTGVCAGGDADCVNQDVPSLYLPYQYQASEVVGLRKWWCRWFRLACPD
jgi:hypothetical protein